MADVQTVQDIINKNIKTGDEQLEAMRDYSRDAQTASEIYFTPTLGNEYFPNAVIPFAPNQDLESLFRTAFGNAFGDFSGELQDAIAQFFTYFPEFDQCLQQTSDNWICDTITNGGTGIPAAVENQIWDRARAREVQEANRMEDEAVTAYAARGFSLPPGALADRTLTVQQDASNKVSTINRDIAIKNIEIEIENIRFAVDQATRLRLGIIAALNDFIRAFLLPVQLGIDKARAQVEAKTRLWDVTNGYYSAIVGLENARVNARNGYLSHYSSIVNNESAQFTARTELRVKAAVAAAQYAGEAAAAALSANNSVGVASNITSQ